jgi:hypothetical protein
MQVSYFENGRHYAPFNLPRQWPMPAGAYDFRSTVILGFATAVSLLVGAAVAWYTSRVGGRYRDGVSSSLAWRWPQRTLLHGRIRLNCIAADSFASCPCLEHNSGHKNKPGFGVRPGAS